MCILLEMQLWIDKDIARDRDADGDRDIGKGYRYKYKYEYIYRHTEMNTYIHR